MNKNDVIEFFDRLAPRWDTDMVRSDRIIGKILDGAGVAPGKQVLDVACGTGVLFPDYLKHSVAHVTGIDIAPAMAQIATSKLHGDTRVSVIIGDAEKYEFEQKFDCIVIYNAFPHFENPAALFENLATYLNPGGRLTVAHGMSRESLNRHHEGSASLVSVGLMPVSELSKLMSKFVTVDITISDDEMYQATGFLQK